LNARIKKLIQQAKSRPVADRRKKTKKRVKKPYSWVKEEGLPDLCLEALDACRKMQAPGYVVYFIQCGEFVKIGVTQSRAKARMTDFRTGSPFEYSILAEVAGSTYLERELHRMFSDYRHRGEWFRLEGEMAVFINAIRKATPEYSMFERELFEQELHEEYTKLSPLTELLAAGA
jgi:hypothetical protein